ncbi:acyl carrier protein [Paracoccaceae bacterium]|nr:acyl carrier protein [Paracoccaceae bacterium]
MSDIKQKVLTLVVEQAGLNAGDVSLESKFQHLNIDSVQIVELIFSLEEEFNVSIPFEGVEEDELKRIFDTVSSLTDYLEGLLSEDRR